MMGARWRALLAALAAALGAAADASAQNLPDRSRERTLGVASCASSLCHGSIAAWNGSPVAQNEYVVWSRLDKHARAHALLLNERSRRIAAKLSLPQPAHQSKVCLDCHAHNPVAAAPAHAVGDGVGCEGCHGPAERWIAGHTEPGASPAGKLAAGLYPTDQPLARARLCLSCHFGTSDKYVTHRMMAAGHPRMSFELDTFTSLQPAHFKVDADYLRRKGAFDGVKAWAVGQAVAVSTRMEILLDPKRGRDGIFPELTLFDCHACHHPMADARWQASSAFGARVGPGLVRLNDANLLMLRLVLRQIEPEMAERLAAAVRRLEQALVGADNFAERAQAVKALADEAARKIAAGGVGEGSLRAIALVLVDDGLAGVYADHAGAEQATLALGSLVNSLVQRGQLKTVAALNQGLAALRAELVHDEAFKPAAYQARLRQFRPLLAASPSTR